MTMTVKFPDGRPFFIIEPEKQKIELPQNLLDILELNGVTVPANQRTNFSGKNVIHLADPQFKEAFLQFYLPYLQRTGFIVSKSD